MEKNMNIQISWLLNECVYVFKTLYTLVHLKVFNLKFILNIF